jgi:hypothetical protein
VPGRSTRITAIPSNGRIVAAASATRAKTSFSSSVSETARAMRRSAATSACEPSAGNAWPRSGSSRSACCAFNVPEAKSTPFDRNLARVYVFSRVSIGEFM